MRKGGYGRSGRELELLAGELGVSPEYLLGRTEKKTPAAPEKKARRETDGIYEALNGQGRTATGIFWQAEARGEPFAPGFINMYLGQRRRRNTVGFL